MKATFRQSMKWFHTWVGLVVGWILFFMFLTGTLGYFYQEISRWMEPERPFIEHNVTNEKLIDIAQRYYEQQGNGISEWDIILPTERDQNLRVGWRVPKKPGEKRSRYKTRIINIATGEQVIARDTGGGRLLYRMHYRLHYLSTDISYWLVGFCSMLMLLAVITGVVIHKKIFTDFFTFRAKKGLPGWLDIHNVLSVIALPFHFMITYSGLIFFLFTYMVLSTNLQTSKHEYDEMRKEIYPRTSHLDSANIPREMLPIATLYQQIKPLWQADELKYVTIYAANDINAQVLFVRKETDITYNPNDEVMVNAHSGQIMPQEIKKYTGAGMVHNGFISLHEGQFAGPIARWLYFLSGLIGAAMIASGLVLWTTKRKPKQMKQANGPDFGYRLVEQLNIGTIVGLPIAIAMYFYANRLLPVDMVGRAQWEAHFMFISWAILLIYPAFRSSSKAWLEQLTFAAFIFLCLPVVNALSTDKHLLNSLTKQDWNLVSFDLSFIVIGCAFGFAAYKFKSTQVKKHTKSAAIKLEKPQVATTTDSLIHMNEVNKGNS